MVWYSSRRGRNNGGLDWRLPSKQEMEPRARANGKCTRGPGGELSLVATSKRSNQGDA